MRYFYIGLAIIATTSMFLLPVRAGVAGAVMDQSNEVNSFLGCATLSTYNRGQTFKPTLNRIVSIDVYLKDRQTGSQITITVKEETGAKAVVGTDSHSLTVGGEGWETFSFTDPFPTVNPESSYGMYTTVNDTETKWCYSEDTYGRGEAKTLSSSDRDFVFVEIGKQVETSLNTSTGNTTDQSSQSTDNPDASTPSASLPSTANTAKTTTTQTSTASANQEISAPALKYVLLNGSKIDAPINETVKLRSKDSFQIFGTGPVESNITLIIGNQTYTTIASADGSWSVKVEPSRLQSGTHAAQVQAKTSSGKESAKIDLLNINKQKHLTPAPYGEEDWSDDPFAVNALLLATIAAIGFAFYYLIHRIRKTHTK